MGENEKFSFSLFHTYFKSPVTIKRIFSILKKTQDLNRYLQNAINGLDNAIPYCEHILYILYVIRQHCILIYYLYTYSFSKKRLECNIWIPTTPFSNSKFNFPNPLSPPKFSTFILPGKSRQWEQSTHTIILKPLNVCFLIRW